MKITVICQRLSFGGGVGNDLEQAKKYEIHNYAPKAGGDGHQQSQFGWHDDAQQRQLDTFAHAETAGREYGQHAGRAGQVAGAHDEKHVGVAELRINGFGYEKEGKAAENGAHRVQERAAQHRVGAGQVFRRQGLFLYHPVDQRHGPVEDAGDNGDDAAGQQRQHQYLEPGVDDIQPMVESQHDQRYGHDDGYLQAALQQRADGQLAFGYAAARGEVDFAEQPRRGARNVAPQPRFGIDIEQLPPLPQQARGAETFQYDEPDERLPKPDQQPQQAGGYHVRPDEFGLLELRKVDVLQIDHQEKHQQGVENGGQGFCQPVAYTVGHLREL